MLLSLVDKIEIETQLRQYIDQHCVFRCDPSVYYHPDRPPGVINSKIPGDSSTYCFMLQRLLHNGQMLKYAASWIADDLAQRINENKLPHSFQLCGLQSGSIALIAAIQMQLAQYKVQTNSFVVRKQRKPYGLGNLIDGMVTADPFILIDDLINQGGSIASAAAAAINEGKVQPIGLAYSLVNMQSARRFVRYKDTTIEVVGIIDSSQINTTFSAEKYWLPVDGQR